MKSQNARQVLGFLTIAPSGSKARRQGRASFEKVAVLCVVLAMTGSAYGQVSKQRLKSFGFPSQSGNTPLGSLILGADGGLYGATSGGGTNGTGTVFRFTTDGTVYDVLFHFSANATDGNTPQFGLVQGNDGALYGTTWYTGSNGVGTLYKLQTNGLGYMLLHTFGTNGDGQVPWGHLIQGKDGALYGVTDQGGTNDPQVGGDGTVFKVNPDGTGYAVLYNFGASASDGRQPGLGLVQGTDGMLYGVTMSGGTSNYGTVFTMNTNGTAYEVLHRFDTNDPAGFSPFAALLQGSDGALYGTTTEGGSGGLGTVFKMNTSGTVSAVLYNFAGGSDAAGPWWSLDQGQDGNLYGTSVGGGGPVDSGTVFKLSTTGSGYAVMHSFTGTCGGIGISTVGPMDGATPWGELVQGPDGTLFGTTSAGGNYCAGTIFRLSTNGADYAVMRHLSQGGDDAWPPAGLTRGADGLLYGTGANGGTNSGGAIFRLNTNGAGYTLLHNFPANVGGPQGVFQGSDGVLYGTTYSGGTNNNGTVFKVSTNGAGFTVLHSFLTNGTDGTHPNGTLALSSDGSIFGITSFGGGSGNEGIVFKLNSDGTAYTVLHIFGAPNNGLFPEGGLVLGRDGNLYGSTYVFNTTNFGGTVFRLDTNGNFFTLLYSVCDTRSSVRALIQGSDGALYGTSTKNDYLAEPSKVFRLTTDGTGYLLLHSFGVSSGDGDSPSCLIQGKDGVLYGTTFSSGSRGAGTVFRVNTNGTGYAVLYAFGGGTDGAQPGGLVQGVDGALYGNTQYGGDLDVGTIFRMTTAPFSFSTTASLTNRTFQMVVRGSAGATYRLEASTNLATWVSLTNVLNTTGTVQFIDVNASKFPSRFYRAVWPP